jgi:hypothetical protein
MINPLDIATDGYLCDPLSIATRGYISVDVEVVEPQAPPKKKKGGSGTGTGIKGPSIKKRPLDIIYEDDIYAEERRRIDEEEMILIIKIFTQACL